MGRLLTFDAQTTRFAEVKVRKDPACPVCGDLAAPPASVDPEPASETRAAS